MSIKTIRQQQMQHAYNKIDTIDESTLKSFGDVLRKNGIVHGLIYAKKVKNKNDATIYDAIEKWVKEESFYKDQFSNNNDLIEKLLTMDSILLMNITEDCLLYVQEMIFAAIAKK